MELLFLFFCLFHAFVSVCVVCLCVWVGVGVGVGGGGGQIKTTTTSKQTNKIQGCCLHEHEVGVLLRTDNTQNHLTLAVRGTAQTAAHHAYIVEIKSIVIIDMGRVAFKVLVDTRVLSGVEAFICCNQDSRVLGRPARRTGVGAGHHDAGGQRDPAHGAGQEVIPATLQDIPEVTTDDDATARLKKAVKLRCLGQTQRVGAGSLNLEVFACNKS